MGIRVEINPISLEEPKTPLTFKDITQDMLVKGREIKKGGVSWNNTSARRSLNVEAGADQSDGFQSRGGYARIGSDLYFVHQNGPQSIELTHSPVKIRLTATTE